SARGGPILELLHSERSEAMRKEPAPNRFMPSQTPQAKLAGSGAQKPPEAPPVYRPYHPYHPQPGPQGSPASGPGGKKREPAPPVWRPEAVRMVQPKAAVAPARGSQGAVQRFITKDTKAYYPD